MGAGDRQRATCKRYCCRRQAVQQFRQTFFSASSKPSLRPDPPGRGPKAKVRRVDPAIELRSASHRSMPLVAWASNVSEVATNNLLPNQTAKRDPDNRSCSNGLGPASRGREERTRKGTDGKRNSNRASRRNQLRSKRHCGLVTQCLGLWWRVRQSLTSALTDGERVATRIPRR